MPERETPVELRATRVARPAETTSSTKTLFDRRRRTRRVLAIGTPGDLPRVLTHPSVTNGRFEIVASIGVDVETPDYGMDSLGAAMGHVRSGDVDTLLVAGEIGASTMRRVADVALAYHCEVLAVISTEVLQEHSPVVVWTGDAPLIQLAGLPRHPIGNAMKRAMDVLLSSIGLLLSLPLLAVFAAAIKLESRGPVLFKHKRVGFRGKAFSCLKLRTMCTDAESVLKADARMYEQYRQNHYKLPDYDDPRVTSVGRFLRRTSIDELPQLWNVFIGEMSLVGPRPVVSDELQEYGPDQDLMLSVKPGLTGAWAVNGRQSVGYPERCALELGYVRDRSLGADTRILLKTIGVVLRPG